MALIPVDADTEVGQLAKNEDIRKKAGDR